MSEPFLDAHVVVRRPAHTLDVRVRAERGDVLAVIGPNGAGKSTLVRALAGVVPLDEGHVVCDGETWDAEPGGVRREARLRRVGMVFQQGLLFPHLTAAENVAYGLRSRGTRRRDAEREAHAWLARLGVAELAGRRPAQLSGGQAQRVAVARALAARPRLLLLDEPLSALDAGLRERLAVDLRGILRAAGTTALMVTHDHEEAFTVADRLAVMRDGRVVQEGPIADVWRAPADPETALFLGYARVLRDDAARTVLTSAGLPPAPAVAVRRSAIGVRDGGGLVGTVLASRATPEQVRLVVDLEGVGEVDAVASLDAHAAPGETVHCAVDATRLAILPMTDPSLD